MTKKQNMVRLIEETKLQWRIRMVVFLKQLDQQRMPKRKKLIRMWQLPRANSLLSIRRFREMPLSRWMMHSCASSLRNGQMTRCWLLYLCHTIKVDQIREAITNNIINNNTNDNKKGISGNTSCKKILMQSQEAKDLKKLKKKERKKKSKQKKKNGWMHQKKLLLFVEYII